MNSRFPARAALRRPLLPALALVLALAAAGGPLRADDTLTEDEQRRGFRARTLLARPRAGAAGLESLEQAAGARLVRSHPRLGGIRLLETDGKADVTAVIAQLAATGQYAFVEPDYVRRSHGRPDDPRFGLDQWALDNTGQAGGKAGADIRAIEAWDLQREAPDVIVAVIDSGAMTFHEDLAANLWENVAERDGRPGVDDDGNGYIDDRHGIDTTVSRTTAAGGDPYDRDGHGSHVAGIIGAVGNNGRGIAGVAWKVQLMPLKFIGRNGYGSAANAILCIDYAIAKGAKIINASYGSFNYSEAEREAIRRARDAGIVFVASAGNDSQEISTLPEYPAAYPLDNIVAVASTTRQDRIAGYSTYGAGLVELAAPGSSILSVGVATSASYVVQSGTSMAAPHVSGTLALLRQRYPQEPYRALINRVLSTVDVVPDLDGRVHTGGRLNLLRALGAADGRPFNDDFARRAPLRGNATTLRASTQFATREAGEPDHGAPGSGGSLWWQWTPPEGSGRLTFGTAGSAVDTVLAVYRLDATATLERATRVAFNDDAGTGTASRLSFDAEPGATYAIAIAGKGDAAGYVQAEFVAVPLNDAFAQARPLQGSSVVLNAHNGNATVETGETRARNAAGRVVGSGRTLWYRWTAPATRPYQISADSLTMDPVAAVFTGATLSTLAQVGFDDDTGPSTNSLIRFNAIAGVTYHLAIDSYSATGPFTLSISDAAWQYVTDDPLYSSPAVGPDGTLYLADEFGYVHAINPDGTRRWRSGVIDGFVTGGATAVGADGTIFAADDFGTVYALNPATGALRWTYETGNGIWAAPAVAADGTVYVKSDDGQLYALHPDGTLKWRAEVPGDTYASPAVAPDGTIYVGSGANSALYALRPDGTEKWRADLGATVYGSPAIGADGTIYLGNFDGRLFAFRPDGTRRWHFDTGSPLSSSPVVDSRGVVYFGSYDRKVYALDGATGAKRWEYTTGDIIRSTAPLLADDGTLYVGSDDAFVHALDPDGRLIRKYATAGAILAAPVLSAGRLIVPSSDGKCYAFDTGNNLARTPWPMHRHNLRRSARGAAPDGIPEFATQPAAPAQVNTGAAVTLSAGARLTGTGTIAYQWLFNDAPLPGATAATLQIPSVQGSHAGTYRVLATGPGGTVTSRPTVLNVTIVAADTARLVNLAVRTSAGGGDNVLIVGFAIGGAGTAGDKRLLVRGVGPTLGAFGVTGTLADPRLQLFAGATLLQENDNWGGDAQVALVSPQVGAFALQNAQSLDAAILASRAAGSYTAQIGGPGTATGIVLAEIYDATPPAQFTATTPRLVNVSARTRVGTGGDILIAGFVVGGAGVRQVLIRGIGPTLGLFNVPGVLNDPKLELFQSGNTTPLATSDNWGASSNAGEIAAAAARVGAFALPLESRDSVLLVSLPPGSYTAQVSGVNNGTGAAIVEVYEVP